MARVPRSRDVPLRRGRARGLATAAAGLALTLAGCGSASIHDLPPAAEPARAPALTATPAGTVFTTGAAPEGIAIDPVHHVAAVAVRDPDRLQLVDLRTRRVLHEVPLPGEARHLQIQSSLSGQPQITADDAAASATAVRVLVPVETAGRLLVVAIPSGKVVADVKVGDHPHDATPLSPTSEIVTNERGNTVTLVEGDHAVRTAPVATQPGGVSALRQGSLVAVVSVRERTLEILDGRTLKRISIAPAGIGPTHVACAPQGPCFVLDTDGDALLVFRVGEGGHDLQLTRRVYLGEPGSSPYGLALDPSHSRTRLWVTLTGRNQLVELAAQGRPHVLSRTPVVRQADSVAVDQGNGDVVVAGAASGQLELLADPASPNR